MFSQKMAQQSLRRLASQNPSAMRTSLSKFASPGAIAAGKYTQFRPAATTSKPVSPPDPSNPNQILAAQRLNRPVSPHLTIYEPQITWYLSIFNRMTGSVLSGGLYVFATAYLVAPLFGWHLESASMAAAFGSMPLAAKLFLKLGVAFPFTFHSFNGVRHLIWDTGKMLTNQQVITSGWTVMGLSVTSALALALI